MRYYSTRDTRREHAYSLKESAFLGLAPDGGLFMPEFIPQADMDEVLRLAQKSFADMAQYVASLFFGDDVEKEELGTLVRDVFSFPCPLVRIGSDDYALELFHGPTCAFKDFGARFMGGMLGLLKKQEAQERLVVLTATSGDTGSAVAAGFHNVAGIDVVVLYPNGKVSHLQESQMTTLGNNIHPIRVEGTFDDCQALVKQLFNDTAFRARCAITSANSINLLRWIPQAFYYFYGWSQWHLQTGLSTPDIVIPSGNYGNATAGMLAAQMGMPVKRFIVASNANDVVPQYLASGVYTPQASVHTIANAMDVGAPSNFERLKYLFQHDFKRISSSILGFACSDEDIRGAIRKLYESCGYISDPHSACGWLAAQHYHTQGFRLCTAHAAKFHETIRETIGIEPPIPETLGRAMQREKRFTPMPNDAQALKNFILRLE